jgi:fructokinase
VMQQGRLFAMIREELLRLLNGYIESREITDCADHYIVPAALGPRSGVLGALVLAEEAAKLAD